MPPNPEPVGCFLVAHGVVEPDDDLIYRSTANTSQHLLTVAQNDLFRVYMDRECDCGLGSLKYS